MKKFLALVLAILMVASLAACGGAGNTDGGSTEAGSVYWLNFKPESDEALKELAAMYTEETGVAVEIVTAASGTYNETLIAEMDKSNPPTLFVVGNTAAVKEWKDFCYDLKDTDITKELNTQDYMLYDEDGKLCSIGYCYECYGIIVNKTLLKEAGYEVADINNFDKLKAAAEDIHARAAELGFDAFTSSAMDSSSSWRFTGHLANLEYYYESVDDPDAWVECPAEIKGTYMDNYKALYDLMVVNSATDRAALAAGGLDAAAEFKNKEAVFYVNGNWEWSGLSEVFTAEDLTMIPYYCGVEGEEKAGLNCGTENYWAVNAKASEENIQATLDFMKWVVTDPEASAIAVGTFGVMPYTNAVESTNPFLAQANAYATAGNYTMPWVTNFQPNVDAYRETIVGAMNTYNADPTDANWELVESAFVAGWATQYAAVNE
ncbi:MAG: carbohydrate ABC transporter substrate-binding protein [Ruminococcus sp.]|nr:carbohydrate ABC transporter substrate-binding protein [Ruminococcus sp.]